MQEVSDWEELLNKLEPFFKNPEKEPDVQQLSEILRNQPAANVALVMEALKPEQNAPVFSALEKTVATEVLSILDPEVAKNLLKKVYPEELASMVTNLAPRDAATVVAEAPRRYVKTFLKDKAANVSAVHDVKYRLTFPKGSAGRLMTTQYVKLYEGTKVEDAIAVVRHTDKEVDIPEDLYIVERDISANPMRYKLLGAVSIRDLLMADSTQLVEEVMATDVICVSANAPEEDAAALISKYKFMTLPVKDKDEYLVGVIPSEDVMQMVVAKLRRQYAKAVGTDAEAMEKLSPFQAAKLRVPWLLGTMLIELGAGLVISHFDGILKKVILLASFLPVISAISGNVGLQAAAITVRAVDTTSSQAKNVWASLRKEAATSLLMALICGMVLGTIGGIWARHLPFGLVIGAALTCSMLTAGIMGTIIPTFSKKLGFDPATTAGPFETAFQDVVGFSVFLWLATLLQNWIT